MTVRIVVLDTGPLGLTTQRRGKSSRSDDCQDWVRAQLVAGHRVIVPEIADFELRRELLRAKKMDSIRRLNEFVELETDRYLPITTPDVRLAADLWAQARRQGRPTASDAALDGDVLIAAQAIRLGSDVIVATDNVSHISRFVAADLWSNIRP